MRCGVSIALALVLGLAVRAGAQQVPPPEDGEKIVTAQLIGAQVEMRDAASGAPILLPKGIELWMDKNNAGSLKPDIQFQAQPAGFDVVYTFTNTGPDERKLGALNIGILTLGARVEYPDLRQICEPLYADYNEGYKVKQMHYPDTLYSPAWVLQNKDYAVGVSLQYPVLDNRHSVRLALYAPEGKYAQGEGGRGWRLEFLLSNLGNETEDNKLLYPGTVPPGQSRVYVVSVRVTKKTSEWVRTLVPYRNWFRDRYGGVSYARQGRCIYGRAFTSGDLCSDSNPFGYGESRPDLNGWGSIITGMLEKRQWDTLLFLTPSGSYRYNWVNNMPYQFATNWNATGPLATAYDPQVGFPRLPAAGQKIAFWWGRSCQVADKWDDDKLEPFSLNNPDHRQRALAEMDLAVKAGATTIGLDTFSPKHTPVWQLVDWLHELKARYPGVRFCAEPVCSDLVHREIATFYRGNKDRNEVQKPEDIDGFYNPHYLADFLLPGHEIWGSFRWATYQEMFGITFTDEQKTDKLRQIASLGFTPCSMEPFNLLDPDIQAAKSWEKTVPPDLQIPDDGKGGDDPFPTFEDFDAAFKAGNTAADLNKDGILNFFDYTAWQNLHLPGGKGNGDDDGAFVDAGKPIGSAAGSKQPTRPPKAVPAPGRRTAAAPKRPASRTARPAQDSRMEIKVTRLPAEQADPVPSRKGFVINSSPVTFTRDELAAAIARAKGLDDSTYADAPDDSAAPPPR